MAGPNRGQDQSAGAKAGGKSDFYTSLSNRVRDDIPAWHEAGGKKIPLPGGGSAKLRVPEIFMVPFMLHE